MQGYSGEKRQILPLALALKGFVEGPHAWPSDFSVVRAGIDEEAAMNEKNPVFYRVNQPKESTEMRALLSGGQAAPESLKRARFCWCRLPATKRSPERWYVAR